ncbi:MAG: hypothetical protein V2J12_04005 [Gammaproteobacteria bacterium]|jgi:hypothetical protein|nr:hypothetical protein [Gammaproteobacteria bacterium]
MKPVWVLYGCLLAATLLFVPPAGYLVSYGLSDQHSGDALGSLAAQYLQTRRNPALTAVLAGFPFLLLALVLWFARRRRATADACRHIALGGGSAILLVMLWANLEYWPNFLPGVDYPGFPHGLELVIAPLHFAPFAMAAGAMIGWLIGKDR